MSFFCFLIAIRQFGFDFEQRLLFKHAVEENSKKP